MHVAVTQVEKKKFRNAVAWRWKEHPLFKQCLNIKGYHSHTCAEYVKS